MSTSSRPSSLSAALSRLGSARILVIGDIMHDVFIFGKVKRISPEAPVPVVEVLREQSALGGAANVVNNLVALGVRTRLAGVVGRDAAGEAALKALDLLRVDRSCVLVSRSRPTAVKTRIIAHQQQVVRFDREEKRPLKTAAFKKLAGSLERVIGRVDAVIVSDYAKGLIDERLMARVRELCRARGKLLAVDPKPDHIDLYRGADVLTPNHREAGRAIGRELETEEDLCEAGFALLERLDAKAVLITRGEKGMSLFEPGKKPRHIPARAREVFDVTGAGDTVIAVLAAGLVAGLKMADAVRLANLAGGIVVGKLGTSVATVDELEAALKNHRRK